MLKTLMIFLSLIYITPAFCGGCLTYKKNPNILVDVPNWQKKIVQPSAPLEKLHGNVEANLVNNYELVIEVMPVENGYCVSLKGIDATIGYDNFIVNIDMEYEQNSCAYNAVLNHEDKHIDAYLGIMTEFKSEIHQSLYSAADSVMPIFIESEGNVDAAVEDLNNEFISHPDLLLLSQKINAAQEIRNKQIDNNENNAELFSCYN